MSDIAPLNHLNKYFVGAGAIRVPAFRRRSTSPPARRPSTTESSTFNASAYLGDDFGKPDNPP